MGNSPLPSDTEMASLRERGQLLCQCDHPLPERVELWAAYQCRRCFKAYEPRYTE